MKTKLEVEHTTFFMPKDKQGYFHRYGVADFSQLQEEALQPVLASVQFAEKLVNILQIQRKTGLSVEESEVYWGKWSRNLPWEGGFPPADCGGSVIGIADLHDYLGEDFLQHLPQTHLFQRDEALNQLGVALFEIYLEKAEVSMDMEDKGHLYLKYVVYAISDLCRCWDETSLQYVAPLYRTSSLEKESFGELSQFYFTNFCFHEKIADVYSPETKEMSQGFYNLEGNFQMRPVEFEQWSLKNV